jgi:peptidoglycan-associated lipoprotein
MSKWMHAVGGVAIAGWIVGCGGEKPKPEAPTAPTEEAAPAKPLSAPQAQALDNAEKETGATGLGIQDEILKLCPNVKPPRFGYDSASVKQEFRNTLMALAECMNEGALKGKELLLVGHADPRGEDDYNMALGGRRAESVRGALTSLGVEGSRMDVSSRGELEASGGDEAGWSKDRRVDIKLKVN